MAVATSPPSFQPHHQPPQIHKLPQSKYIDSLRWLPSHISPFQKSILVAFFDTDADAPSLETHALSLKDPHDPSTLTQELLSFWTPLSRISALRTSPSLAVAATTSGSLHVFSAAAGIGGFDLEKGPDVSVEGKEFHVGGIGGVDLAGDGGVLCVGEDGRVNLVSVGGGDGRGSYRRVFDGNGLVSYTAVRWGSPSEFATGGCGFGLQWWDLRLPAAAVAQFKGILNKGNASGIIHSIDIHPSRKHTCVAGGSSGTVFAWDLRWQQQPIILSGAGKNDAMTHSLNETEVWEVQYDCYTRSSNSSTSSSRILPVMICSEEGILSVLEQGEESTDLLTEPCAINNFDIDSQNPSDVICSLEWESIALICRP